ncbi:MAG: sigma-70 family RNA polymerase sigma factor [Planctomycetota bacterium]
MTPLQSIERELAQNAGALRALALDLVGRDHADDLVQETALRALRTPPPQPHALAAWLATILRRLASSHRRAAARRQRRERLAATPEAQPPASAAAARRDSLRAVTAAQFGLPEPYQSTLLLRYFEGLPPAAIAAQLDVPPATVKSRLQRGLVLLRTALDRRGRPGEWRAGLCAATGLVIHPVTAAGVSLGVLMTHVTKLTGAAAALLLGAALLWQLGGDPTMQPEPAPAAVGPLPDTAAARAGAPEAHADAAREALAHAAFGGVDLSHPFAFALRCRAVDRLGLPVAGIRVAIGPTGSARNRWPEVTDDRGEVLLQWNGRAPAHRVCVAIGDEPPRELELFAGGERTVTAVAPTQSASHERAVLRAVSVALVTRAHGADTEFRVTHGSWSDDVTPQRGLHPELLFADPLIATTGGSDTLPGTPVLADLPFRRIAVGSYTSLRLDTLVETAQDDDHDTGAVAGIVYGEDGEPAAGVPVCLGDDALQPLRRTESDENGAFRFERVPIGPRVVRAGGDRNGLGRTPVLVAAVGLNPAPVHLRREQRVHGTAVGVDGEPLSGWWVEFETHDGGWADRDQIAEDGSFDLANQPAQAGRVQLRRDLDRLPSARFDSVLPGGASLAFDLRGERAPRGAIALRLPTPAAGADEHEPRVTAWQRDSGRGVRLQADDTGRWSVDDLPAGFYRVEVACIAIGTVDLGEHWLDGRTTLDLGTAMLPLPGTLRVERRPDDTVLQLCHRRAGSDIRALCDMGAEDEIPLPAGEWLLFWRDADGSARVRAFTLRPGACATVDLGGAD